MARIQASLPLIIKTYMVEFDSRRSYIDQTRHHLPDRDRLSVLTAMILLAFSLTHFIKIPVFEPAIQLPGFYLAVRISIQNIVLLLVAGLTAAGADWLFHDHPALKGRSAAPYWLLPSLTVFGIGLSLFQLPFGTLWWISLLLGGMVFGLVLLGEYISIDSLDIRQPFAAVILTAVSFALYLVLAVGLHLMELRLFILVPAMFVGTWLVSLRSLHLRLNGEWVVYEAGVIAFLVTQIGAALIYWPLSPLTFGLVLLGPTYALNGFFIGLIEERPIRQLIVEPLIALVLTVGAAFWTR